MHEGLGGRRGVGKAGHRHVRVDDYQGGTLQEGEDPYVRVLEVDRDAEPVYRPEDKVVVRVLTACDIPRPALVPTYTATPKTAEYYTTQERSVEPHIPSVEQLAGADWMREQ